MSHREPMAHSRGYYRAQRRRASGPEAGRAPTRAAQPARTEGGGLLALLVPRWLAAWLTPRTPYELGQVITFTTMTGIAMGLIAVESASYPLTSRPAGSIDAFTQFWAQAEMAVVAALALWLVPKIGERWLAILGAVGFWLFLGAMIAARLWGGDKNGNFSWTRGFGPIPAFQPSEFAKACFVIVAAFTLGRSEPKRLLEPSVRKYLGLAALVVGALVIQHDLGMMMLFGVLIMMLLVLSGLPATKLLPVLGVAGMAGSGAVMMRFSRVASWLWPMKHLDGAGYHIMNCKLAIARGAGLGLGIGRSPDKWYSLPFPQTDSIFCVWTAETGLWGTALMLGIFGLIAWYAFTTARRARCRSHFLLAAGCGFLVAAQAAVNMAVATNLIPPTGLTLPFVSYGRSSLLGSALAVGLVLWVARRTKAEGAERASEGEGQGA